MHIIKHCIFLLAVLNLSSYLLNIMILQVNRNEDGKTIHTVVEGYIRTLYLPCIHYKINTLKQFISFLNYSFAI